jgi:hypothetical protein
MTKTASKSKCKHIPVGMMFAGITLLMVILFIVEIIAFDKHLCSGLMLNLNKGKSKRSFSQQGSATTSKSTSSPTATGRSRTTLHVIQCLSGNDPYFIDEWEIGLKSILVNAPLDSNLHVHLIADNNAAAAINERINNSGIENSAWRNKISVILHNVDEMLPSWRLFLTHALTNETSRKWMDNRVGIGGYLRLLAHRVVVPHECGSGCADFEKRDLERALYADTDVVIIGNLNHLMHTTAKILEQTKQEGKGRPLWIWNQNSGFLVMDLLQFERVWELAATIPNEIKNSEEKMKGDQWLLKKVEYFLPSQNTTAIMPEQWSTHTGHGFRRNPQKLYTERKQGTGMLHFTMPSGFGFGNSWFNNGGTGKWCKLSPACNETAVEPGGDMDKVRRTWGLAEYYAQLSWEWAIYQGGTSRLLPGESYALKYIKRKWHPDSDENKPPIHHQYTLNESEQLGQEDLIELTNFCGDKKWLGTHIRCDDRAQYLVSSYQISEQNAKFQILKNGCECSVSDMPRA